MSIPTDDIQVSKIEIGRKVMGKKETWKFLYQNSNIYMPARITLKKSFYSRIWKD